MGHPSVDQVVTPKVLLPTSALLKVSSIIIHPVHPRAQLEMLESNQFSPFTVMLHGGEGEADCATRLSFYGIDCGSELQAHCTKYGQQVVHVIVKRNGKNHGLLLSVPNFHFQSKGLFDKIRSLIADHAEAAKMIQTDNPSTFTITLDISDLQADLPLFGACTSSMQTEEVTLVDPNTLAPLPEKEVSTEQVLFDQDIVYVQEEQVETQEVPQAEFAVEVAQPATLGSEQETIDCAVPSSQNAEEVIELELEPGDESDQQTEEDEDDGMSFISDDLASLFGEDLDGDLERAAKDALSQKSLRPIINEELKTLIQHRRVRRGKRELRPEDTRKRPAPHDDEEVLCISRSKSFCLN